ncbi:MAG: ribosomal protein [Microvirga sp.]|jgi:large subunit ribosomal protein L25|uniref:Large ribosomal subunit protein bL25 n=1 Tax=Microvirga brassicacearum TaxID=2580413 RepID=A0A5N3P311_9HYPH|nr:50S ribosomal protein L25/general stress protein Ctc [Microvirga brassicacearum]KAB0264110.1 50S ribosomal protein L25/general stress protein Ctc [Microvirga brassicacearum]MDF2812073.1 ribosomal protein [Microvirga sp.]
MSDVKQITAVARDRSGKGAARAVRRQGKVPAVIYGAGQPATGIALDFNETKRLIFAGHFLTTIFEIDVDGKKTRAIPRDYQLDPVRDFPVHVDFLRLSKGQSIKVVVPVHVVGQDKCPGVKRGGTINIVEHSIELLVPSDSIPDAVEASVADLDIGSSIHIADIKLPNGAKATSTENLTLVTVVAPSGMQEEEEAPAAEAAAAAPAKAPAAKA